MKFVIETMTLPNFVQIFYAIWLNCLKTSKKALT